MAVRAVVPAGTGSLGALSIADRREERVEARVERVARVDRLKAGLKSLSQLFTTGTTALLAHGACRISTMSWAKIISSVPTSAASRGEDRYRANTQIPSSGFDTPSAVDPSLRTIFVPGCSCRRSMTLMARWSARFSSRDPRDRPGNHASSPWPPLLEEKRQILDLEHVLVQDDLSSPDLPLPIDPVQDVLSLPDENVRLRLDPVSVDQEARLGRHLRRRRS